MTIGIYLRKEFCNKYKYVMNEEIVELLEKYNCNIIGIKNIETVKLCDGVILQGGDEIKKEDIEFVKYLYEKNIPTMGICLGMQMMCSMDESNLIEIKKHYSKNKYVHYINISSNSKLFQIIKDDHILVNSRHKYAVEKTNLNISSYSSDNIIESVEASDKKFFIGVQWHPESLKNNIYSERLFKEFIKICQKKEC